MRPLLHSVGHPLVQSQTKYYKNKKMFFFSFRLVHIVNFCITQGYFTAFTAIITEVQH